MTCIGKGNYESNVETRPCPVCGRVRPVDWYVADDGPCWSCRPAVRAMHRRSEAARRARGDDGRQLSPGQAARCLHMSENRVRQLLRDGQLKGSKVGGRWLISASDIIELARKED